MKKRYFLIMMVASMATLVGCSESKDGVEEPKVSDEVIFGTPSTRSATEVSGFETNDVVYIASSESVANGADYSSQYSVTSTMDLESETPLNWTADDLSFYAVNQELEVNSSDAKLFNYDITTAERELLWVSMLDQTRDANSDSSPITVVFNRCLSRIEFDVTFSDIYASVAPELEFYVKANTAMVFDPWATTFVAQQLSGKPTTTDNYASAWSCASKVSDVKYDMMAIPQTFDASSEMRLVVKDSAGDVVKDITSTSTDVVLKSGCVTTVNLTITKEAQTAVVSLDGVSVIPFESVDIDESDKTIIPNHD
ncbi:MAG: fimbrillin family protein [Rikenellaceae bacterium]